ncbi:TrpB-like pyridoxal phosphate-dependent enzyme [uncultured Alistipes sp.]|uniref:TrpB-like pyridoxal phosphate-dependent enzyme n=1 Tax=uncultured Alistipes sp. TaxID=538949 RepID=UPI00261DE9BF|nr:TrpB-like pyridoxal phosphate-dependent enzyme [uncultured Alistipes sp.]
MKTKKFILTDQQVPAQWYNIAADMPNKPLPPLDPRTRKPVTPEQMNALFAEELVRQEFSTERFIDIPDEVRDCYRIWRCTPLVRAYALEKALDTPAHIYFKNESVSPAGSHKPNTALPQAYYNARQGIKHLTTETGGGQWGSAIALASQYFGLDLKVFMVKVSYQQKPYRKLLMNTWGAEVIPSPSTRTEAGRHALAADPDCSGNLGLAISEAVETALQHPEDTRYCLGSVLNHVLLHQTIIGEEALLQMEMAGEEPDVVIGCFGGGSNFAGIGFPFLGRKLRKGGNTRIVAVEPASCPKLTRGEFQYDFGDVAGMTPMLPMYTLGHDFQPADIHAGGLRYHGAGSLVSQLLRDKLIDAVAVPQLETFSTGLLFARTEGIVPAPESTHAIAVAVREALKAKEEGRQRTILFNLSGHGMIDLYAYEQYFEGKLQDYNLSDAELRSTIDRLDKIIK